MGLGAKLNLAFIAVILVMVLGHAGYSLVVEFMGAKTQAEKQTQACKDRLGNDIKEVQNNDMGAARALAQDQPTMSALVAKDRGATASAVKSFLNRTGFPGFIILLDDKGSVFYSSETPAKYGDNLKDKMPGVADAMVKNFWNGPSISPTGTVTSSAMLPIATPDGKPAMIIASQPLDQAFLTGVLAHMSLDKEPISGVEMAIYVPSAGQITAVTADLVGKDGGVLDKIKTGAIKVGTAPFESGGRLWTPIPLLIDRAPNKELLGDILVSAPITNIIPKVTTILGQAGISAAAALVIAFVFAAAISGSINNSLRFLIQRARDLGAQKSHLAPLEGLNGEWLELGELMDTSVSSLRSSVQSLKTQVSKRSNVDDDRLQAAEAAAGQLETVNRQLSEKTKQLTELSKQINFANQQAVVLQQKLDSVLMISTEGYLVLDQYGNVISANPTFLNWMGATEGEIAGRLCFDLVKKPGEPPNLDGNGQVFSRHSGNPGDLIMQFYPEGVVYHRQGKRTVEVLAHLQPVVTEESNIQAYIMVLRDKSLRSEITHLRTEIVSMLSDSIRAPLAVGESKWKGILNNASKNMHPSVGQSLAELHTNYENMLGLVDSLLMMYTGAVPPPTIPRETVVVTRLVADCLEEVSAAAKQAQLMLDYKTATSLPNLQTDGDTLKRVMIQLLESMMTITPAAGRVRVESQVRGNEMRIGVLSSGELPQNEIDDMFVGFIQGKHPEESYSSRLSMYLARNNVERLGGKIWAESEEGRGTAVYFILPVV